MKRKEFFLYMMGFAGFGWLIPAALKKQGLKEYTLYEGWVAGYFYYDGPEIEQYLRNGQPLQLRREPGNRYDNRAIEILTGTHKLGYIPKIDNHVLARLMDHGTQLKAEIADIDTDRTIWNYERVKVRVWK